MPTPLLLLISGPPCAGKTTLGTWLAQEVRLPLFYKDGFKELLFDTLGWGDRQWSRQLGGASMALLWHVLERELVAGRSVIGESNFRPELDGPRLQALRARYGFRLLEVHCTAPHSVLLARLAQRATSGARHPGHLEQLQQEEVRANLQAGVWGPLSSGEELLTLDTSDVAGVGSAPIVQMVRARLAAE